MEQVTYKPWGNYADHFRSRECVFKIITVDVGQRLSLQRHERRCESWCCLAGKGLAIIDGTQTTLFFGRMIEIPCLTEHRLENTGAVPLVIAEMQCGECDENDIVRIEDDYGRAPNG